MKIALNKQTTTATAMLTAALLALPAVGCVSQSRYNDTMEVLEQTQMTLEARDQELAELHAYVAEIDAQLLDARAALAGELHDNAELQVRIDRLERMREELQRSNAMYLQFVDEFAEAIDAGNLEVLIDDGRVTIALPEDVLFTSGEAMVRENGVPTLTSVAVALSEFDEREFQVEGHTDSDPINTDEFPSNWDLSAARALNVVDILVQQGVSPNNLSAAGYGSHDPRATNDTEMGRQMNRRVEIVLVPDLGFMQAAAPMTPPPIASADPS